MPSLIPSLNNIRDSRIIQTCQARTSGSCRSITYGITLLFVLGLFIDAGIRATNQTTLERAQDDKAEVEWKAKDEIAQFDSVRKARYENPEMELAAGSNNNINNEEATDGAGGSPLVEKELDQNLENDVYVKVCGDFTLRRQRPGYRNTNMPVQYTHIPKAGGMAVQHALSSWARVAGLRYFRHDGSSIEGSSAICPGLVPTHDILAGHRGFGFCNFRRGENMFIFTVFREPVARMVSQYDYNLKSRGTLRARGNFGLQRSLSQWVIHFNNTPEIEHGEFLLRYSGSQQARFMCGYECMGPAGKAKTEEIISKRALENLKKLKAVGYLEDFNALLDQLKVHLKWVPRNGGWPHLNVATAAQKSELDERARSIMREWAKIDIELYTRAVKTSQELTAKARQCIEKVEAYKKEHGKSEEGIAVLIQFST